jgi:hypothetical protein
MAGPNKNFLLLDLEQSNLKSHESLSGHGLSGVLCGGPGPLRGQGPPQKCGPLIKRPGPSIKRYVPPEEAQAPSEARVLLRSLGAPQQPRRTPEARAPSSGPDSL